MRYSTGVVYHHFQDKQEIIDAIEAAETERMRGKIAGLLDGSKDVIENITAVFHEIMLLALKEPEKYNLIVLHKYSRQAPGRPGWLGYLAEGLRKGMQAGLVRQMDADQAAFCIWSSFLGFNLMVSRHTGLEASDAEALYQTQLQMIVRGILHQ
jgi:AcrR family transcriptional regulator